MTYPTVTNTVLTVSGLPLANAPVNISLSVGGFNTDDNNEMNSGVTVYTNASGVWSATLKPNALINPNGTYYTVSEPNGAKWTAIVPNGAGPYLLVNILTATPPNPTPGAPFVTSVVGQTGAVTGAQIVADSTVAGTFVHQTGNESIAGVKSFSSSPVVPNNAALDNSTKTANTAYVDTAVATQHTADTATYAPLNNVGPTWSGKAMGLLYNGTNEAATLQTIINTMSTFGGGQLLLEAVARSDAQLNFPQSGSTATQARMAPIRITGPIQYGPGSTFSEQTPKLMGGLDLRYNGRTDTSCSTTIGSTFVTNTSAVSGDYGNMVVGAGIPDWSWIIGSIPGSGWVITQMARATASGVSCTNFGGRLQALNYGNLEIDHIQLTSGGTSSAPFGISTAPNVNIHDCTFEGMATKGQTTCDEDQWIFGGPGQGTYLTSSLTSGSPYTTLAVAATPTGINSGAIILINTGGSTTQQVTTSSYTAAGATSIAVVSFNANANYAANTSVLIGQGTDQSLLTSWNVPIAPFQGYMTRVWGNQFYRTRSMRCGMFATDLNIFDNSWMHNCGSTITQTPTKLTSGLTAGTPATSLAVSALTTAVLSGDTIQIGVGPTAEVATASAGASVGATSISINSLTPTYTHATNTVVFDSSAGLSAPVISHADAVAQANTIHVRENRLEVIGYNYGTIFKGFTQGSVITANNFQDVQAAPGFIAGHRFETGSSYNEVTPGLSGQVAVMIDDRAISGSPSQTSVNSAQGQFSQFPQGIQLGAYLRTVDPAVTTFNWTDPTGLITLLTVGGAARQWAFKGPLFIDGNSAGNGTTFITVGNNSTASDAQITLNPPTGQAATVQFKYAGTNRWQIYNGAGASSLFVRDMTNALMALTFTAGSGVTGTAAFAGIVSVAGTIQANTGQTTITGTTAGTAVWTQPFTGSSYKRVTVYLNGYQNSSVTSQLFNFPTAFTNPPYVITDASGGATINASQIVLPASMGSTKTGWIIVEGY